MTVTPGSLASARSLRPDLSGLSRVSGRSQRPRNDALGDCAGLHAALLLLGQWQHALRRSSRARACSA
jgi:hypothetical protein